MPLRVECPAGHKLIVPDDRAGQPLHCPRCESGEAPRESGVSVQEAGVGEAPLADCGMRSAECGFEDLPSPINATPDTSIASPPPSHSAAPPLPISDSPSTSVTEFAPTAAVPLPVARALAPDRRWRSATYLLAAAIVAAALFGTAPAIWDVIEYWRFYGAVQAPAVARWALVLLLLSLVQVAYAVYLYQLPDWTSVWVATLMSLAAAGVYAMALGLVFISRTDGGLVGPHGLQLADKLAGGQAALWCLAMVSVWTIVAFFAGRLSVQWLRAEAVLRRAGK